VAETGRPRKFETVEALQQAINTYFDSCFMEVIVRDKDGNVILNDNQRSITEKIQVEPFTITGLALALDTSRETLMDIENANGSYTEPFSDAIKNAKMKCHNFAEKHMFTAKNPAGAIFALKNYGWKDKHEVEHSGDIKIVLDEELDDLAE